MQVEILKIGKHNIQAFVSVNLALSSVKRSVTCK